MPVRQSSVAVGSLSQSLTFFNPPPVEFSARRRGVATLSIITNGTSGATTTNNCVTTCERSNLSTGLTVNITAAGGVATAIAINAPGSGYYVGQQVTVIASGGSTPVTARIDQVGANGAANVITLVGTGTSGVTTQSGLATFVNQNALPNSGPAGLTVNATAGGGVVTALTVVSPGANYRIGDIITVTGVTGATGAVTASVATLTG